MFSFAHRCSTITFKAQVVACNIGQHNMNIIKIKQKIIIPKNKNHNDICKKHLQMKTKQLRKKLEQEIRKK